MSAPAAPVARAEAYAAKLVELDAVDVLGMTDIAMLGALAVCVRRPLRRELPAIRAAYPALRAAARDAGRCCAPADH